MMNEQQSTAAAALDAEASAFDRQIEERVRNGHIPDLRLTQPCDHFYNNSWRRPEYVRLDMHDKFSLVLETLQNHLQKTDDRSSLLEVGCGPGHMTLELARNGFHVTGIDLSAVCIETAGHFAESDPWKHERGVLRYLTGDFFTTRELQPGTFDAIIFVGSLHHFADQNRVMERSLELLNAKGIILANEPTRDRVTEGNAILIHLLRVLLSAGGGFYRDSPVPQNLRDHQDSVAEILSELKYQDSAGDKLQSVNDNDAGHNDMYGALRDHFLEFEYRERYAFFHEMIGGLRFDEETNSNLARFLRDADSLLCRAGVLQSTEFFFAGRRKS